MRIAVSNIAWDSAMDRPMAALIHRLGGSGVEVAPTKRWARPPDASAKDLMEYRHLWETECLEVAALQALLYGRPDLQLFGPADVRDETQSYLAGVIRVAGMLGADALVFGSPKNRRVEGLDPNEARAVADAFFGAAGEVAIEHRTTLCIEPNPLDYGADFITTVPEARAIVERVNHPGFGLHLDVGGMLLSGDDIPRVVRECGPEIRHFHVSEPFLAPVDQGDTDHDAIAAALRDVDYQGWVSIEMRPDPSREPAEHVSRALERVVAAYA